MERSLYGPDGFYVAGSGAGGHFRTSASASPPVRELFAGAIGVLLDRVDSALDRPDRLDLVDVGAGSGDLLEAVLASIGSHLAARVQPAAVELRHRPVGLSEQLRWLDDVPDTTGLLIANEWLDNVPVDVAVGAAAALRSDFDAHLVDAHLVDASAIDGDRVLLVDRTGAESPGPTPTAQELAWLARWWPTGQRREIGIQRDAAWAEAVSRIRRGLAVAIDYSHTAADRPAYGTLTAFRRGRETGPIPDGLRDLTAHVAIDSVAAAGAASGTAAGRVVRTVLTDQRTALGALGLGARRPDYAADPSGYGPALQRASDAAELLDSTGLGAFSWLLQGIDLDPADLLR